MNTITRSGVWYYNSVKVKEGGVFGGFLRRRYLGRLKNCRENKFGSELQVQGKLAGNYTFYLEYSRKAYSIIIEGTYVLSL